MHITAYTTMACRYYDISKITKALQLADIDGTLQPVKSPDKGIPLEGILAVMPGDDEIPNFSHPIKAEFKSGTYYVIDARPFLKLERNGEVSITNLTDYKFLLFRAGLNNAWDGEPDDLLGLGDLATIAFIRWLTNTLTSRFGLDPENQVRLTTVTIFYWYSLFRDEEFSDRDKNNILKKLTKVSFVPMSTSMTMVDDIPYMPNITDYIEVVKDVVGSSRLENLNIGILYSMLGGSWFGLNAKEVIAVSLEHPPTFIAMVLSALESRSYRKTYIGKLVLDNDKRGMGNEFTKGVYSLIYP